MSVPRVTCGRLRWLLESVKFTAKYYNVRNSTCSIAAYLLACV